MTNQLAKFAPTVCSALRICTMLDSRHAVVHIFCTGRARGFCLKMLVEETRAAPVPDKILSYWENRDHRAALAEALGVIFKPKAKIYSQSAFIRLMADKFHAHEGANDLLGRLIRQKGNQKSNADTLHWILVTLFYVYQHEVHQTTREEILAVFKRRSVFRDYSLALINAGYLDGLVGFTDVNDKPHHYTAELAAASDAATQDVSTPLPKQGSMPTEAPVEPIPQLAASEPLAHTLRMLNIGKSRHFTANEFFFAKDVDELSSYERAYYVLVSQPPRATNHRLSLLVLRSGTAKDAALTYTHYQKNRRGEQILSNGVLCPTATGYTLFGGFRSGASMETIFASSHQQDSRKINCSLTSLDPDGLPFFGDAILCRLTQEAWDNEATFRDQDLALCDKLANVSVDPQTRLSASHL